MGIIENAQQKIVDLQGDILDLTTKNQELERENRELRETLSLKGKMKWTAPVYYVEGETDPYCPKCWEGSQKQIHLFERVDGKLNCKSCDGVYNTGQGRPPLLG